VDEKCVWQQEDPESYPSYESSCGAAFNFENGGLKENGFKFCHKCGKPIQELPFQPTGEDTK
jgi:hypothetical protein